MRSPLQAPSASEVAGFPIGPAETRAPKSPLSLGPQPAFVVSSLRPGAAALSKPRGGDFHDTLSIRTCALHDHCAHDAPWARPGPIGSGALARGRRTGHGERARLRDLETVRAAPRQSEVESL